MATATEISQPGTERFEQVKEIFREYLRTNSLRQTPERFAVLEEVYADLYGVKVLGVWPYSAQVVYCNAEIAGLSDLAGKKVRASGAAIGEVVQGLQKGVVDCAITGSMSGFNAKWHEVSTHIYELPIA